MRESRTAFTPAQLVDLIEQSVAQAEDAGVIMNRLAAATYTGQHVEIAGQSLCNFGSCSYLGLELRRELKEAAIEAVERYGTQFSFSRAYLESPLYAELEELLASIAGGPVLVTPSTTLAHIAALPVLVEQGDAVLIDQFAHASMQTSVGLLKGIHIETIRHSRMASLSARVERLAKSHRRIWYILDGLYSMLGDFAPMDAIWELLEANPQLNLYVDDAHSTSWIGERGCGHALDRLMDRERVVVALSLNKAFSAAGGALVLPDEASKARVRRCGGPMLFSGPVQPPMLGAAVASAKLHLDPSFSDLQRQLADRIDTVLSLGEELGIALADREKTPIFFVRCGRAELTFSIVQTIRAHGFYVSPSVFPAVPHNQSGFRFTVTLHNTLSDIHAFMRVAAEAMKTHGVTEEAVADVADEAACRGRNIEGGLARRLRRSEPPQAWSAAPRRSQPPPAWTQPAPRRSEPPPAWSQPAPRRSQPPPPGSQPPGSQRSGSQKPPSAQPPAGSQPPLGSAPPTPAGSEQPGARGVNDDLDISGDLQSVLRLRPFRG
jgi:7-keto-8-aminopelargonate synthetase-like enzyme